MSPRLLFATIGLLSVAAHAQTAPCLGFNDTNTNVSTGITASPFVGLNPSSRAYQFSTATALAVQAASIFTGSPFRDDYMRVELWDEDPATGAPGNRLAAGTMFSPMSANGHWLGSNLDAIALLSPNTNYWFVWVESGGSVVPEEPGGTTLPRRTRTSNNAWGALGTGEGKFRLYCNQLDSANVTPFGPPTQTSLGQVTGAFTNDEPLNGSATFGVEGTNLPGGATAWMVIGIDPNFVSTPLGPLFPPGFMVNSDSILAIGGTTGTAEIGDQPSSPRPAPLGFVRFSLPIPAGAGGVFLSAQVLALDSGSAAAIPLVGTNAIRIVTL